jgi:hypothetical protein
MHLTGLFLVRLESIIISGNKAQMWQTFRNQIAIQESNNVNHFNLCAMIWKVQIFKPLQFW